jgi:hypothetical protein
VVRAVDRRAVQRLRRVGARARVVTSLAGFRGAVSLAAVLAVPETVASGQPFPDRDVIVFVTSGVIVVTLLQALVLPAVVRWARLPADGGEREERQLAETLAAQEALEALPELAARLGTHDDVVARTRAEYEKHLRLLHAGEADDTDGAIRQAKDDYTALRRELIAHKRSTVVRLRDERRIDDTVLRQIQAKLDIEEIRLTPRQRVE